MWIAEIFLTVFAWQNGWRWKALLPLCIGLVSGCYIGTIVSFTGGTTDTSWTVIFDIATIIVLIVMCTKKPFKKPKNLLND